MIEYVNMHGWGIWLGWFICMSIITYIYWLIFSSIKEKNLNREENKSSIDILKMRYSKGKITKSKYYKKLHNLNEKNK